MGIVESRNHTWHHERLTSYNDDIIRSTVIRTREQLGSHASQWF